MQIYGTLTTLSPLTIGAPGDLRVLITGKPTGKGGFPCQPIACWNIPASGRHPALKIPVVKANSVRGMLRRAGAALIEEAVIERGEMFDIKTYNALRSGAPFGNPDKVTPTISEIQTALETPPLAIFGGGPRMIRSALRVDTGVPVLTGTIERGLVDAARFDAQDAVEDPVPAKDAEDGGNGWWQREALFQRMVSTIWRRRGDDLGAFIDPATAERVVVDYTGSVDAWQALVGRETDADVEEERKAGKESKVRGLSSWTAMQAINPGITFSFSLDADTDHAASLGYLLLALERFAQNQKLGGNGRIGFGRFRLDLSVDLGEGAPIPLMGADKTLNLADERVKALVDASRAWLAEVDVASLDALMCPSTTSVADLRGKLVKSHADADVLAAFDKVTA